MSGHYSDDADIPLTIALTIIGKEMKAELNHLLRKNKTKEET